MRENPWQVFSTYTCSKKKGHSDGIGSSKLQCINIKIKKRYLVQGSGFKKKMTSEDQLKTFLYLVATSFSSEVFCSPGRKCISYSSFGN